MKVWFRPSLDALFTGADATCPELCIFTAAPMSKALGKRTPLPSKEATLFKELLTLYETRQIKKGLKTADLILKKFPDHGGVNPRDIDRNAADGHIVQKHYA